MEENVLAEFLAALREVWKVPLQLEEIRNGKMSRAPRYLHELHAILNIMSDTGTVSSDRRERRPSGMSEP